MRDHRSSAFATIRSFLSHLCKDTRGNTLAIVAAAMIPMMGIIGFGVDISRAYVAKTRLQQACDAGVLGGRKVMGANGVDSTVTAEVRKFVNYNFPQGTLDTGTFQINPTLGGNNSVDLTLTSSEPTVIMRIFGSSTVPISATCTARQDFVNTDIMLVLDTTLSMNCLPSDPDHTYCTTERSGAKIQALRAAVTSFYNALKPAQTQLESQGLRLRYGIVPYSLTVNAGQLLRSTDPSWVNGLWSYRNCSSPTNPHPTQLNQVCNTSAAPSQNNPARDSAFWSSWSGCIEERQTVNSIDQNSGYTPPSSAYDLAIDMVPNSSATRWNVYDPGREGARLNLPGADSACPKAVQPLQVVPDVSNINSYTASMTAGGFTYHDLGILWGGRLLSPNGLWAGNNPSTYNNFPVNRHLVFMTDGVMEPSVDAYSAYGVEKFDRRVTGTGDATTQYNSHLQRFRMLCNAVKGMNVNIWVVAFGTSASLTPELINCANTPSQAFQAADQAALIAKFTQIGQTIGALRLSQ